MKKRTLIFIFVIALTIGLVANIPVNFLVKDGRLGQIDLYGVSGTLWNGEAARIDIAGGHQIENAQWSINPLYVLLGRLQAHLKFSYLKGIGYSDVSVSFSKTINISNFEYTVEADQFTQKFASGFVGLEGDTTLQIDHLNYKVGESFSSDTIGYLLWSKSGVAYPVSGAFGNVSVNMSQDEESRIINGEVSNTGGEISLSGTVSMAPDRTYKTDILIKPKQNITEALKGTLKSIMRAQSDGNYRFNRSGRL